MRLISSKWSFCGRTLSSAFIVDRVSNLMLCCSVFRLFEELAYRMRELRRVKPPSGGNGVKTEDKTDNDEFAAKFDVVPAGNPMLSVDSFTQPS